MLTITAQSPLEKIFAQARTFQPPYLRGSGLGGETVSYQLVLGCGGWGGAQARLRADPPWKDAVRLFRVGHVPCELPAYPEACDEGYLTTEPGLFPDPLFPLEDGLLEISSFGPTAVWVDVNIPSGCPAGSYPIRITAECGEGRAESVFTLDVAGADLPEQELIYTQWFHVDCIAEEYGVPVYSERHWELLERYLKAAAEEGMNMVLTPMLTPPLDTQVGGERPCTQLVEIRRDGGVWSFGFSKAERFVEMAERCGIHRFEIAHLFTQWGAEYAPSVYAVEQGVRRRVFGWDTPADSPVYREFLAAFLPALTGFLREKGLADRTVFHISDEPGEEHLDSYRRARDAAAPYLEGFPIYDALSDYRFYERGVVDHPVAATDHIGPFLEHRVPGLWAYYCCGQNVDVGNRFLAMPSARSRILGLQLYKYGISGFLHWGFNFWYTQYSKARIDPYRVTDADRAFPGGDAFSVYPGPEGPVKSLRMKVFHHALQDLRALSLLEQLAGREAAEACICDYDSLTFSRYPREAEALLQTRERVNENIREICLGMKKG